MAGLLGIGISLCLLLVLYSFLFCYSIDVNKGAIKVKPLTPKLEQELYLYADTKSMRQFRVLKKIVQCESSWNPSAYNEETKDSGLFQINNKAWTATALQIGLGNYKMDWKQNIELAMWIYNNYGTKPWYSSSACWNNPNYYATLWRKKI